MDWKKWSSVLSVYTILIFTACSNATATPTSTSISSTEFIPATDLPVVSPTSTITTTIPDTAVTSLCANQYYPVREGATWTYQSTGSPADDDRFTDTITSVRDDGFTLTTEYEKFTHTQEWTCTAEGLLALQLGGPVVSALQSQAIHLNLGLKNVSGITFPRDIVAGDRWQQILELEGDMNIAGEEGTASGTAQMNFSAIGTEAVSVPAGDFDAMKIQADMLVNLDVTYEGLTVPVTYTAVYTYWFAPDVGWVKANGNAHMTVQSFTENIELQSYEIP